MIKFVTSITDIEKAPEHDLPEIVFAGRSNSGKSSLINLIAGRKIAYSSSVPGKTATINFFSVKKTHMLVDLPGYGYSKGPQMDPKNIETFLNERPHLAGFVLVMDIRRKWSKDEDQLLTWLHSRKLPWCLALNKSDKLNQSEKGKAQKNIRKHPNPDLVFLTSKLKKIGYKEVNDQIHSWVFDRI
jgi:GTP-binding protein